MFTRIRTLRAADAIGLIAIGAVITLVLSGTAMAITDNAFTYSAPQSGRLSIHPMDLSPGDEGSAKGYYIDYGISGTYLASSGSRACFNTGVHLPDGAKITSLRTYYAVYGTVPGSEIFVLLVRNNLATDTYDVLAEHTVSVASGTRESVGDPVPTGMRTVDNSEYSYGFGVCLTGDARFEGARINYQYTSAGD